MTVFTPDAEISWPAARQLLYTKLDTLLRAIHLCTDGDMWEPALILVYSGMDAMAWLGRPASKHDTSCAEFVDWSERYLERGGCLMEVVRSCTPLVVLWFIR